MPDVCASCADYVTHRAMHSHPPWGYMDQAVLPQQVRFWTVQARKGQHAQNSR